MRNIFRVVLILLTIFALIGCSQDSPSSSKDSEEKVPILNLPPMKNQFAPFFLAGNIFNPGDVSASGITNQKLTHHFNVLTPENHMKPDKLAGTLSGTTVTPNASGIAEAKRMVDAAAASGIKVVGHTLLWHSQNASWITNLPAHNNNETTRQNNITIMRNYVTAIVGHTAFKGRIYSWDVLNEVFPDSASGSWKTAIRPENPWFKAIGSDFIYYGFLAARLADPDAILYYNDYNTDQLGKATMIRDMVSAVNAQYLTSGDKPSGEAPGRLLIEGIGMQEHHNLGVSASSVGNTINLFRPLGVKISVSELDVLAQTWGEYSSQAKVTEQGLKSQAKLYGELLSLYRTNHAIIERVSFWGVTDNQSWRARGQPLLFDSNGMSKAAYYSVIRALQ
jgi:endo-1,4-beta-xylanase